MNDEITPIAQKRHLKPLRIQDLIGGQTAWTDALRDEVGQYCLERLGTFGMISVAMWAFPREDTIATSLHKVDILRLFRAVPLTVLLGAFDRARREGSIRQG